MSGKSRPPDAYLDDVVRKASNQVEFRTALRQELYLIDHLSEEQLRKILTQCRIKRTQSKTAQECKAVLCEWFRANQEKDDDVTLTRERTGGKRKPAAFDEGTVPPSERPLSQKTPEASSITEEAAPPVSSNSVLDSLQTVYDATFSSNDMLSKALSVIRSVIEGHHPDKKTLSDIEKDLSLTVAANRGLQVGLKTCLAVWREMKNEGTTIHLGINAQTQQTEHLNANNQLNPKMRYADAARRQNSVISQRTSPREPDRHSLRKLMAEKKKKLRSDTRSFRFRSVSKNGMASSTMFLKHLFESLGIPEDPKLLVEDVRSDRYGTIYVQTTENAYNHVKEKIRSRSNNEKQMVVGQLGPFFYADPVLSAVAGKTPMVIKGIDMCWSDDQFTQELWDSNHVEWGIAKNAVIADHLTAAKRLSRHKNAYDDADDPKWLPSRNYKVFVSHTIMDHLREKGATVRFDFQLLGARLFISTQASCSRCLQTGHTAATCRSQPRCKYCKGQHLSADCKVQINAGEFSLASEAVANITIRPRNDDAYSRESNTRQARTPTNTSQVNEAMSEDDCEDDTSDDDLNERLSTSLQLSRRREASGGPRRL